MVAKGKFAEYRRVSRVGDRSEELRSPEIQRARIAAFVAAHELELEQTEPELDVSGSKLSRPILDAILERIEAGELAGLIVAELSRLARLKPGDRVRLFERVEAAGGSILSAAENIDPSTPQGRFARDTILGVWRMDWGNEGGRVRHGQAAGHRAGHPGR
jgi:DNA invertase Pin-like site-specific DNA recombinase